LAPEVEEYAQRKGIAYWSYSPCFYGPAKAIAAQWEYTKEKFSAIPGATFTDGTLVRFPLTPEQRETLPKPQLGTPSISIFAMHSRSARNPHPASGHLWFAPLIPRTGEALFEANRVFHQAGRDLGLSVLSSSAFTMPFSYYERVFLILFGFEISTDIEANKKTRAAYKAAIKIAAEHGWGEYRSAPAFYDNAMGAYSYNNQALLHLHETIKDAVDPNGILSAGRYGIWPKQLRRAKEVKES